MSCFDFAIIGGGIAGIGVAERLAGHASVIVLEAEEQLGYHSTGRSNALFHETYGGPGVQPLTSASRSWLERPPAGIAEDGFLTPRDTLTIGRAEDEQALSAMEAEFAGSSVSLKRLGLAGMAARLPGIRSSWDRAILETNNADIDVARMHQALAIQARRLGVNIVTNAKLELAVQNDGNWQIQSRSGNYAAKTLINAAGAWADDVARRCGVRAVGIRPFRRTIVQLGIGQSLPPGSPMVLDINGTFYFKHETGNRLWLSPHDETPTPHCDAAPEELDIAIAIDRLQEVVDWKVERVEHSWAGLRSFAADRLPVYGFDTAVPGFFWCAGQGGFGIQTAPAASALCAHLLLGGAPDTMLNSVDAQAYAPSRASLLPD